MTTQEPRSEMFVVSRPESGALGHLGLVRHFAILERNGIDLIHERYENCVGVQSRPATSDETWKIEEAITDMAGAIKRLDAARQWGRYSALLDNCEHMAHYIATGVKRSYQVQTGVAALITTVALITVICRTQKSTVTQCLSSIPTNKLLRPV